MCFESLPNELYLATFRFLQQFDLIYAFSNLNQRLQKLIEPYTYHIDLTRHNRASFRQFQLFCMHILRLHIENIRSVKLAGHHQLQLLYPHIHSLINLEMIVIEKEDEAKEKDDYSHQPEQAAFLREALTISSLSTVSITLADDDALTSISSLSTTLSKLTNLSLIYFSGLAHAEQVNRMPPSITHFTISLKSIAPIVNLLRLLPNLVNLNLLMVEFNHLECKDHLKLPAKLETLHLEFGGYRDEDRSAYQPMFEVIRNFLAIFKTQLKSLTLVVNNAVDDLSAFDKLQNLVSDFMCLEVFEYCIRSDYPPDSGFPNFEKLLDSTFCIFTLPKPQSLGIQECRPLNEYSCYDSLTFKDFCKSQQLYNCGKLRISRYNELVPSVCELGNALRYTNLVRLMIYAIEEISMDICRLLAKLIPLAIDLNFLHVTTTDTVRAIKHLREIIPKNSKQIIHFELSLFSNEDEHAHMSEKYKYDSTFFSDLVEILPNLNSLSFYSEQLFTDDSYYTCLSQFIDPVKHDFQKLTHLTIGMRSLKSNDRSEFERFKHELNQLAPSLHYKEEGENYYYDIHLWL